MTIKKTYDKDLDIITIKVIGYLELDDYMSAMSDLISSPDYPSDANTIWDLREMKFDNIDMNFQKKIIELHKHKNNPRRNVNIAIISDYDIGDPILKLFIIQAKDLYQTINVFRNMEDGIAWLQQRSSNH